MAIVKSYPSLRVEVLVDNEPLKEHHDTDDEDVDVRGNCRVIRYVEAEPRRCFAVKATSGYCEDWSGAEGLGLTVNFFVDGQLVKAMISANMKATDRPITHLCEGVMQQSSGIWLFRKFKFHHLVLVENESTSGSKSTKSLSALGEIKVEFTRVKCLDSYWDEERRYNFKAIKTVSEKSLKGRALSQTTSLDEGRYTSPNLNCHYTKVEPLGDGRPIAVFTFRYRSLADLKAQCIIPRSPSPLPLEARPVDELTAQELRELLRRTQDERNRIKQETRLQVKRERFEDDGDVQVIEERRVKRRELTPIDLTGD